mmetsp:Transcript_45560/g.143098  ORF Transcript_45560/g.143098 Transcript_45560/m.143098 type:complete len:530 (-) Transcript_45560:21-1610(-)
MRIGPRLVSLPSLLLPLVLLSTLYGGCKGTGGDGNQMYDKFDDMNNVFGLVGESASVYFLGRKTSVEECEEAALKHWQLSGRRSVIDSFTWHSARFYLPQWQGLCFGRSDGVWAPDFQKNVVGGRIVRSRWRSYIQGLRGLNESSPERTEEESANEEETWKEEEQIVRDLGRSENGGLRCNVLEWRLKQRLDQDRFLKTGRSCSMCGWRGCKLCPAVQICGNESGGETIEVHYSDDHQRSSWADIIMFPANGEFPVLSFPPSKPASQAWVAIAGESSMWWPHVEDLREDKRFDLVMGYSRQLADMHASYVPHSLVEIQKGLQLEQDELRSINVSADIAYFASNCNSDFRQSWVKGLMEAIPVDSYGQCEKNKELPLHLLQLQQGPDEETHLHSSSRSWRTAQEAQSTVKMMVISRYKFALAVENTRDVDYVTEKMYEVLQAGAVPIYLGAPNWKEFFPFPSAVIDAAAFESPHDLADYVRALSADPERYEEMRRWRREKLPETFKSIQETSFTNNLCRVCRWKADRLSS